MPPRMDTLTNAITSGCTADGVEIYIRLNPHNNLFDSRIDTTRRVNDYYLRNAMQHCQTGCLTVPAGYKVDICHI